MFGFLSPHSLARTSARHPWLVLGAWAVVIAAALFAATDMRIDDKSKISGTDSQAARELLESRLQGAQPPGETVVISSEHASVDDPAFQQFVAGFAARAAGLPGVIATYTYFETGARTMVSADGHSTLVSVSLAGEAIDAAKTGKQLLALVDSSGTDTFSVATVGDASIQRDMNHAFDEDAASAEILGLPVALVVLVIVFGAVVAAGVPLVLGVLGILVSVGVTALLSHVFGIGSVVANVITMIGLAVGIDYTLFIIERFREERRVGVPRLEAVAEAANTAGRAVLFSGLTVIIALAGLLIVPVSDFRGIAIGAITAVASAIAIAMTLLPALLALLDRKLNWLSVPGRNRKQANPDPHSGFFGKTTALVMRHPVISIVASVSVLLAAAAPLAGMNLGQTGLAEFPGDLPSVRTFQVIDSQFSAGQIAPTKIVIAGDTTGSELQQAVGKLASSLAADPRFHDVSALQATPEQDLGLLTVIVDGASTGDAAQGAVRDLRARYIPAAFQGVDARVFVGGESAGVVDYVDTMSTYLPIVIAFVLALSFILLMMVFRSIVIPVKAILMNLLSVGAAYGLLVLVFQHGVAAGLLGFRQTDTINAFLPVFLFAILFGLSMDYHVFLLSRIQERFLQTRDNRAAVAQGLRSTAHIITGAAAIMMAVFAGFASGQMLPLQQMGFGLAVAVFLDATLVRSVLVPASMELLGAWNWYLPAWLGWLPRISVEGRLAPPPIGGHQGRLATVPAGGK
jgi:RND superfamily putative drug exporter